MSGPMYNYVVRLKVRFSVFLPDRYCVDNNKLNTKMLQLVLYTYHISPYLQTVHMHEHTCMSTRVDVQRRALELLRQVPNVRLVTSGDLVTFFCYLSKSTITLS